MISTEWWLIFFLFNKVLGWISVWNHFGIQGAPTPTSLNDGLSFNNNNNNARKSSIHEALRYIAYMILHFDCKTAMLMMIILNVKDSVWVRAYAERTVRSKISIVPVNMISCTVCSTLLYSVKCITIYLLNTYLFFCIFFQYFF